MKRARNLGGLLSTSQRRDGVAMFARELERRFGRIEDLFEPPSVDIITRPYLAKEDLEQLFRHQACAVHVPEFYPKEAAASAASRLEGQTTQNWKVSSPRGLESSDVLSVGKPYNVAAQEGPSAVGGEYVRKGVHVASIATALLPYEVPSRSGHRCGWAHSIWPCWYDIVSTFKKARA